MKGAGQRSAGIGFIGGKPRDGGRPRDGGKRDRREPDLGEVRCGDVARRACVFVWHGVRERGGFGIDREALRAGWAKGPTLRRRGAVPRCVAVHGRMRDLCSLL